MSYSQVEQVLDEALSLTELRGSGSGVQQLQPGIARGALLGGNHAEWRVRAAAIGDSGRQAHAS